MIFDDNFETHLSQVVNAISTIKIIDVNQATLELYQAKNKEHLIEHFSEILTPHSNSQFLKALVAFAEGKTKFKTETVNLTLEGNKIEIIFDLSIPRGYEKTFSKILISIIDITNNRIAEIALRDSKDKFNDVINLIAHDLQEPLRTVKSYLTLLERKYKNQLDPKANQYISYAVDGAIRMQELVTDLLTYSQIDKNEIPFRSVNSQEVINNAIKNLNTMIETSKAIITTGSMPMVRANSTQLSLLFQNLLSNAIKFQSQTPAVIQISAEQQKTEWLFSVTDNGIGIQPEFYDKIFLMFHRLHNKEEYPGTGMGLTLCKRIVELHKGRIWVESTPGQGSAFYFTLPF